MTVAKEVTDRAEETVKVELARAKMHPRDGKKDFDLNLNSLNVQSQ